MDIWLDTTSIQLVQEAVRYGILAGVTTNPTLIAKSDRAMQLILEELLDHQEGPVTAQVVAEDTLEMIQQAKTLYALSERLIIKIPMTRNGLEVIRSLSMQGIPTMATVIFHPRQALLAALAGENYVAPYLGRMEKADLDAWAILKNIKQLYETYCLKTKILGASLQTIEQVMKCAEIGIDAVTLKDELFRNFIETDPLTSHAIEQFNADWKNVNTPLFSTQPLRST